MSFFRPALVVAVLSVAVCEAFVVPSCQRSETQLRFVPPSLLVAEGDEAVTEAATQVVDQVEASATEAVDQIGAAATQALDQVGADAVQTGLSQDLIVGAVGFVGLAVFAGLAASMSPSSTEAEAPAPEAEVEPEPVEEESVPAPKGYDVSVPYDAAGRLAYQKELRASGNLPFFSDFVIDEGKFAEFYVGYKEEAVAAVIAKKEARESATA